MRKIKFFITVSLLIIIPSAFIVADADDTVTDAPSGQEKLYCPEPSTLQNENGWWKVDNIWKSDSQSSGKKIKSFLGAQWIGVNIGKIICLYTEEEKHAFPVALTTVKSLLVFAPTASIWIETKKGYKNCISNNVADCSFVQKKLIEDVDVYEQIKYTKKNIE